MISRVCRRTFLAQMGSLASCAVASPIATPGKAGLHEIAARRGILYGAMTTIDHLRYEPFRAALSRECGMIVPGNEMKWGYVEKQRGASRYDDAEAIAAFASSSGKKLRGHTAAWYLSVPTWAKQDLSQSKQADLIYNHVREVTKRFAGRVSEWDVVNEEINPQDGLMDGRRNSILYRAGGPEVVAECFKVAHDADPSARLVYNDFGLEYWTPLEDERRRATLKLLSSLKVRGVPVHGLGIQCHLKVGNRFNETLFRKFLADVAALGLNISITELDFDDMRLSADVAERDRKVADHARQFLNVALDEVAVKTVMTWGLSDRFFWLTETRPRIDGLPTRGLPFDAALSPKPLWDAIAGAFDTAPDRR